MQHVLSKFRYLCFTLSTPDDDLFLLFKAFHNFELFKIIICR